MIRRTLTLENALSEGASILLLGPRGVGKTQLIRNEIKGLPYSGTPKDVVHLKFPERPDFFKLNLIIVFLWIIGGLFSASESFSSSNHRKRRLEFNHRVRVYVSGDAEERDG